MAFLRHFFHTIIDRRNPDAAGQNPTAASPQPQLDQLIINQFLSLSRSTDPVDITDKLQVFRQCNLNISSLKPESSTRKEINNASVPLLCGKIGGVAPVELAPRSSTQQHPYVRLVEKPNPTTLDYSNIFEKLGEASDRVNHPAGLSSLTFAFGSLISLCTSYPDRTDVRYNKAPGYLDLLPLYGLTDDDNRSIRKCEEGRGLLLQDSFFEDGERLLFLPRAASVLLVLLSRNHNYIARRLLEENEDGKWSDPSKLDEAALAEQDNTLFQLARRINCGTFRNIVANDFLKGLLGFGTHENNPAINLFSDIKPGELSSYRVSVEFSLLYNWNSMISEADAEYIGRVMEEKFSTPFNEIQLDQLTEAIADFEDYADMDKGRRPCVELVRDDENDRFDDAELAEALQGASESTASAFRGRGTEICMKILELSAMKQARDWNVCSFNEFRKLLGLPAYTSFTEWCSTPQIATAAQEVYGDIDKLELYAGLRGEQTVAGAGFCLGKTMVTQGLIVDIVNLVRSDPNFTKDFTPDSLTQWGYEELTPNLNNGAFGACLPKLLLRHLPNNYTYNNVYGLFPFTTPNKCRGNIGGIRDPGVDYEFGRPESRPVKTLDNLDAIRAVLGDPAKYPSPYGADLKRVTGGYGYMLGFDDKNAHDGDEWLTLKALLPDSGAFGRYATFYRQTAERLIREKSKRIDDTTCRVDVIQDVINAVSACWAAEKICGIPLDTPKGYTPKEVFQMLLDLNNCIFGNVEPQDCLVLRSKAIEASKNITACIERNLGLVGVDPDSEGLISRWRSLFNELYSNAPPESHDSHDFLARLYVSGRDTKELSANALGLAVLSSVSYAQTCAAAVRFYLDDARAKERDILRDLAKKGPEVNGKIMGYIRESQRLDPQIPLLYRDVAFNHVLQVGGYDPREFRKGDRICADFKKAHAVPGDIDPDRDTRFLQGAGFHKCIGVPFVEKTMPEVFKAIFRLEDLRCEVGKGGRRSLFVSYKKSKGTSKGENEQDKKPRHGVPFMQRACDVILIILAVTILYWITISVGSFFSNLRSRVQCPNAKHLRPWQPYTMFPGPDNKTAPFIYYVQDSRPRKLSFVDIDERDMQFKVFVDGKLKRISTDFELNKSVYCGENLDKCFEEGFSKASVIVPPGKHIVKVEWIGKDFLPGTTSIDWGSDRRRRFMWKQESC